MAEFPKLLLKFFYLGRTMYLVDEGQNDEYENDRYQVYDEGSVTAHVVKDQVPEIK